MWRGWVGWALSGGLGGASVIREIFWGVVRGSLLKREGGARGVLAAGLSSWVGKTKTFGGAGGLVTAVSSSRLMKTKPLAVPGRWRQMTLPGMRRVWPGWPLGRAMARQESGRWGRRKAMGWGPMVRPRPE